MSARQPTAADTGGWKPHIYRVWNCRSGRFGWAATAPRANSWTGGTTPAARVLERQAVQFCYTLNRKERNL